MPHCRCFSLRNNVASQGSRLAVPANDLPGASATFAGGTALLCRAAPPRKVSLNFRESIVHESTEGEMMVVIGEGREGELGWFMWASTQGCRGKFH
jgi:hypothetical protein